MKQVLYTALLTTAKSLPQPGFAEGDGGIWDGYYVGVSAGSRNQNVSWEDKDLGWFTKRNIDTHSAQTNNFSVGLQVGRNFQLEDGMVFGWELAWAKANTSMTVASPAYSTTDEWTTSMDNLFTLSGKMGIAKGKFLPYAELGVAMGDSKAHNVDNGSFYCSSTPCELDIGGWQTGLIVGVGVDYQLSKRVSLDLSYRHVTFGGKTYSGTTTTPFEDAETYTISGKSNQVSLKLNYLIN